MSFYYEFLLKRKNKSNNPKINFVSSKAIISYTDEEFTSKVEKIRNVLLSVFNVNNMTVAISPGNNESDILVLIALCGLDVDILFIPPLLPQQKVIEILDQAKADIIMSSCSGMDIYNATYINILEVMDISKELKVDYDLNYFSARFIFPTSGSTSSSKLVLQEASQLMSNAKSISERLDLDEETRFLGVLPVYHVNGFHLSLIANLLSGSTLTIVSHFDPFIFSGILKEFDPHLVSVVPTILESIYPVLLKDGVNSSLEAFISAAAPLSRMTALNYYNKFSVRILQGYGLSETTNMSTLIPRRINQKAYEEIMFSHKVPSIGYPLSCNNIKVVNSDGCICPSGTIGELLISGENVFKRYLNSDNSDIFLTIDNRLYFKSGDLGYYDFVAESKVFFITGRIKNVAKINGVGVSIEEMEQYLINITNDSEIAVVPVADSVSGQEELVLVTSSHYGFEYLLDELNKYFRNEVLPSYHLILDNIPRSSTGKILRPLLKKVTVRNKR